MPAMPCAAGRPPLDGIAIFEWSIPAIPDAAGADAEEVPELMPGIFEWSIPAMTPAALDESAEGPLVE